MDPYHENYGTIRKLLVNHRIYSVLPTVDDNPVVTCTPGSKPGDNYMSIVKRMTIPISTQTTETKNVSLIIKRPVLAVVRRRLFRLIDVFRNEIHVYQNILPYLQKFLIPPQNLVSPECYFAGKDGENDIIILEDLSQKGFNLFKREFSMDLNFCKAAMKELARFHSTSLIAKTLEATEFKSRRESLLDVIYSAEAEHLYTKLLRSSLAIALFSLVKSNTDSSLNEPIDLMRQLYGNVFKCMRQCVLNSKEDRSVVCHGDLWVNNIMVNETSKSLQIKFIDYQAMRYGSPVFDILHVLYTGTRRQVREDHIQTILETYCSTLADVLQASLSDIAPDALRTLRDSFSLSNVMHEYNSSIAYGLGVSMWILPAVTFDPNNLPNLDDVDDDPCCDDKMIEKVKEKLTERYHAQMKETTLEFYENGYLQELVDTIQRSPERKSIDEIDMERIYEEVRNLRKAERTRKTQEAHVAPQNNVVI